MSIVVGDRQAGNRSIGRYDIAAPDLRYTVRTCQLATNKRKRRHDYYGPRGCQCWN